MNKNHYLHFAVVFKGSNLNYGEGVGNIIALKKLTTDGKNYSYISRQALRYDIVRMLNELYQYKPGTVNKEAGVIQFADESTIKEFPELDFFGYMKTKGSNRIRKAVVRLTDALSLEPFNNDIDFATNKGLADRIPNNTGNDIFQAEIHRSYYCYTITCNLNEIGVDPTYDIDLDNNEKAQRVKNLLNVIKLLNRDIRGKRENLSPLFSIGGLYDVGNPFFYNRIKLSFTKDKILLNTEIINDTLTLKTIDKTVGDLTQIGFIKGEFSNVEDIKAEPKLSVEDFFENLKKKIDDFYGIENASTTN